MISFERKSIEGVSGKWKPSMNSKMGFGLWAIGFGLLRGLWIRKKFCQY